VLDGLIARYTFESAAQLGIDESGNGHHGTPSGPPAAMWVDDPSRGGVMELDGATEYLAVPFLQNDLPAVTVTAWVNVAGVVNWEPIYTADGWSTGWVHFQVKNDGKIQFSIKDSNPQLMDSLFAFTLGDYGRWFHVAAVHDQAAGTISFYVDGNLGSSQPLVAPLLARLEAGRIGGWDGGRWFHGRLDDVRFYKRGLSADEVAKVFDVTR